MPKSIQIFRPGRHTAMSGAVLNFSEDDLSAVADAYDAALHEAPLVIGHPRHDAPAYGWVSGLLFNEGALEALPTQVDSAFAEMVDKGRFKKVSASFYPPAHPANPKPGIYYLRHVGFLGAQPPAIKGLKTVEFADEGKGIVTIEFSERERWGWLAVANLLRNLREQWIEKDGVEAAEQILPSFLINDIDRAGEAEESADASPAYSETEEPIMPDPNQPTAEQTAAFAERESQLSVREQGIADCEAALAAEEDQRTEREVTDFAEQLAGAGRILPRHQAGVAALLTRLPNEALEFGEGDDAYSGTAGGFLRDFLNSLPAQVDCTEHSGTGQEEATVDFAAPDGYTVDQSQLALHRKIVAYQGKHDTDYATAARAVGG
ncbi:peptidase [Candidatus Vondammii sp. HM_W22]|uniref:peptidase n=1 Tax=Candidatus Vondammii sp. HM_W22 TaxID=2687299 RepID=UPI002E7B8E43|nr:peptidase [Candidatus Vondammii sp. HM_W22]